MSKYSDEFKLEVVQYYLKNGGYRTTANKFEIPTFNTVRKWVKKYEEHGEKGLLKNLKTSYSGEFKQHVIEYMHDNHLSCQEVTHHFNLGSVSVVSKWERIYYEEGPQSFYEEHRGRKKNNTNAESLTEVNMKDGTMLTNLGERYKEDFANNINNGLPILTWQTDNDKLNLINGDSAFVEDINNINNGYPILAWQ